MIAAVGAGIDTATDSPFGATSELQPLACLQEGSQAMQSGHYDPHNTVHTLTSTLLATNTDNATSALASTVVGGGGDMMSTGALPPDGLIRLDLRLGTDVIVSTL